MSIRKVNDTVSKISRKLSMPESALRVNVANRSPRWVKKNNEWVYKTDDGEHVTLMTSKNEKIPLKDFSSEVRATMDVNYCIQEAVFLLDITETSQDGILNTMLQSALAVGEPNCSPKDAKSGLVTSDSVHLLAHTIQGTCATDFGGFDYDQSWLCAMTCIPSLQKKRIVIGRLKHPVNMGRTSQEVRLIILVLCPTKEKETKNCNEMGRTFGTLLCDMDIRQSLLDAEAEEEFKRILLSHTRNLSMEQSAVKQLLEDDEPVDSSEDESKSKCGWFRFGGDIKDDIARRLPFYISDYTDAFKDAKSVQKTVSTTFFLYFACILPAIAFGVLNDKNTNGKIDVKRTLFGQCIAEVVFSLVSGQPLIILLTSAPLSIFIKVVYTICDDFDLDFYAMYCWVGLWNAFFLIIYAFCGFSRILRWSTRSTEEIFGLFISTAFAVDSLKDMVADYKENYINDACALLQDKDGLNMTEIMNAAGDINPLDCRRDSSVLFTLLMLATVWLGVFLFDFKKTPFLSAGKREALSDYALPIAVLIVSFFGSYIYRKVPTNPFPFNEQNVFVIAPMGKLNPTYIPAAMGLGFILSLLIFMDQNISSAMVNNPSHKLKKGTAYHWDLLVAALLNGFLSLFGFPWMHATIPHSPLHVRALADVEERVDQGHVHEIIVRVRETRVTGMLSHALIGVSLLLLPYPLSYIPTAVLDGLFLYMAVTALGGNQMYERVCLLFTEQAAYPPNHYIRRVPQKKIHLFTLCQLFQLAVMCVIGFNPVAYVEMGFPIVLLVLLPIRQKLIPRLIEKKYLDAMDAEH